MTVVAIVQARMGSSRLPGKSLMALAGRPLIDHVLERAQAIRRADRVILATSESAPDAALVSQAWKRGVPAWLGSEWDVLGRMAGAARWADADAVVRITGDCPLLAPDVADAVVDAYLGSGGVYAYASNDTAASGYPDGTDVEVFSRAALELAAALAQDRQDREHVTPFLRRAVASLVVRCDADYSALKLSVDRAEDYDRVARIYRELRPGQLSLAHTLAAVAASDGFKGVTA